VAISEALPFKATHRDAIAKSKLLLGPQI